MRAHLSPLIRLSSEEVGKRHPIYPNGLPLLAYRGSWARARGVCVCVHAFFVRLEMERERYKNSIRCATTGRSTSIFPNVQKLLKKSGENLFNGGHFLDWQFYDAVG